MDISVDFLEIVFNSVFIFLLDDNTEVTFFIAW